MNQKEATYNAVMNVVGSFEGACQPSKEQRAQVNAILFEGFRAGTIELDREFDDKGLKAYCSGLQSNWLRKDNRLNGGVKYTAKNPGSRAGSGDASLKAMRALLSTTTDASEIEEIQSFIDKRVGELKKTTVVTINVDDLPAELKAKYLAGK
jgi:hypothetical protein